MPLRMKIQSININSHVLDRLHHAETQPQISYKATTKSPFSLPLSSSNEHCQDRSFCTKCALYLSTTNITTSKTSQATHTRLSPMPSPSLQHCLFHQTFPYNNNKNSNIIKNKYAECSHGQAFVASTLYEVEGDRVGVPLLSGLYEVPSFLPVF
ncbi:BnaC01g30970D [Brassica napus]|uniref:(rape) hypothetical protein n=1 Tax=Brassica napus TaxID=3708 RepID=A0A078F7H7_BRANA|nr:unnamed protein product [Brassica napus]CDY08994.1 BnaC01g30970D [Brassica napus]